VSRVYFTDRNLGKRFPETLVAAGLTVVQRLQDQYRFGIPSSKPASVAERRNVPVTASRLLRACGEQLTFPNIYQRFATPLRMPSRSPPNDRLHFVGAPLGYSLSKSLI
jgi:hypothetical protein